VFDEVELRRLVRAFVTSGVQQLSLHAGDLKVEIEKHPRAEVALPADAAVGATTIGANPVDVRSPAVGIVRWPPEGARDAPIDVGDHLEADEAVCSIDMLGKHIPVVAHVAGTVAELCVGDGAFVEYGDVVMRLTPGPA
jgi:biotin carboxyl carrier protein